ncbi:hypothetical protein QBC43DRAFT_332258 [Cladorrhinum sp. PSN259]|nr:hypothetical protein QBC43DRAFT_332258 [Cladorrhinum sp. PSN259]
MAQPTPPPQPSLGSNNPFRRKSTPAASGSIAPTLPNADSDIPVAASPALPTGNDFWNHLQGESTRPSQPPPTTSFQKPKVVKKVRVQSPPPSSPESGGGQKRVVEDSESDDDSDSDSVESIERLDPFTVASAAGSAGETANREEVVIPISTYGTPPPNPFQSTARDLQSSGTPGSGGAKGGLDVNAFGRLLLTGQTGGAPPASQHIAHQMLIGGADSGSNPTTAASSISRQSSISDPPQHHLSQDHTPRTSHEISEHEAEDEKQGLISRASTLQPAPTILRKKPPPPSSRHGKLIRPESSQSSTPPNNRTTPLASPTPRDINKPLPFSPEVEETANIFDHSAAGKVPEPRPPTPPPPSSSGGSSSRKPAPPAPRRQPHRQQSSSSAVITPNQDEHDSSTRRSSLDSVRSRSSSLRMSVSQAPPPAPPPRRHVGHGRGPSFGCSVPPHNSAISPGGSESFAAESPLSGVPVVSTPPQLSGSGTPDGAAVSSGSSVNMHHLNSKLSPPPPPPARNLSVRGAKRPVSLSERKGSGSGSGLKSPPPPVPKHRGEGLRSGSTGSLGSFPSQQTPQRVDDRSVEVGGGQAGDGGGQPVDILADLTRLQREVDALRAGLVLQDGIAGAGVDGVGGGRGR